MILVIDNYDSFVYNLARYVRELGDEPVVRRNDAVTPDEVAALGPSHVIISPGPCSPTEAGVSTETIRRIGASTPILGVCLGHQCIGAAYGAEIVRAKRPMHGKVSRIHHDGSGIFADLLTATFPGGSITGAPKIRAMEIIAELEPSRRGVYCGSIGYLSVTGTLDASIVIRTYAALGNRVYFSVGGGIVADSDPEQEYRETLDKARALIAALRTA